MKTLILQELSRVAGAVMFRISDQTHRQGVFGNRTYEDSEDDRAFRSSDGISLVSWDEPEWRSGSRTLFVRGGTTDRDEKTVLVTEVEFDHIRAAVDEYNRYFYSDLQCEVKAITLSDVLEMVGETPNGSLRVAREAFHVGSAIGTAGGG